MADASDHDLLIRLDEKMDAIITRLEKGDACMKEHEQRIAVIEDQHKSEKAVEQFKALSTAKMVAAITALATLATFAVDLLLKFVGIAK